MSKCVRGSVVYCRHAFVYLCVLPRYAFPYIDACMSVCVVVSCHVVAAGRPVDASSSVRVMNEMNAWVPTMGAVDALARVSRVTPPRGEARRLGGK